jgi:RES domain-containing protein
MEVFRLATAAFSKKLAASGVANRWNLEGQQVLYTGGSRSLSTLELIVHRCSLKPSIPYFMMVISIVDDDHLYRQVKLKDLPANWRTLSGYTSLQNMGAIWYNAQETMVLKVPSAVIPYEYNYLINAEHPDFKKKVHLVRTEPYFWDERLIK